MQIKFPIFCLLLFICVSGIYANDATYKIIKLNTPSITIGSKTLKTGDTFNGTSNIKWVDDKQMMEVKDVESGSLYKFSKKVFDSKGAILSIADFFLTTNKASSRESESGIRLTKSPAKDKFPEKRIALVMGNSNYYNLSYLRNAQKDASDIAEILLSLGFDVLQVYESNFDEMKTALNKFASLAQDYDVALFYFAGHGLQEDGKNYLIPVNANLEFRSELNRLLNCDDIVQRMETTEAPTQVIFIDACRNAKKSWSRSSEEGLARMEGATGSVIVFSTQSGKVALDGEGDNSPFAAALIENIAHPSSSFSETMNSVVKETYNLTEHKQYPLIIGSLLTDFNFNPGEIETGIEKNYATRSVRIKEKESTNSRENTSTPTTSDTKPTSSISEVNVSSTNPAINAIVNNISRIGKNIFIEMSLINRSSTPLRPRVLANENAIGYEATTMAMGDDGRTFSFGSDFNISVGESSALNNFVLPPSVPVKLKLTLNNASNLSSIPYILLTLRDFDDRVVYGIGNITLSNLPIK